MPPLKVNLKNTILIFLSFLVIVIVALILKNVFKTNPYGPEIKITNFSSLSPALPTDEKNKISAQLYSIVDDNYNNPINSSITGAIRESSISTSYDQLTNMNYGNFLVDLETIEQSYFVQYEWSSSSKNPNFSGYNILILCPKSDQLLYPAFPCTDSLSETKTNLTWENSYQLDYTFGVMTSSKIRSALQPFILDNSPTPNPVATVAETSMSTLSKSDNSYSFTFTVNNQSFKTAVILDDAFGQSFIAIYCTTNNYYTAIILTDDQKNYEPLATWLANISGEPSPNITYQPLH